MLSSHFIRKEILGPRFTCVDSREDICARTHEIILDTVERGVVWVALCFTIAGLLICACGDFTSRVNVAFRVIDAGINSSVTSAGLYAVFVDRTMLIGPSFMCTTSTASMNVADRVRSARIDAVFACAALITIDLLIVVGKC